MITGGLSDMIAPRENRLLSLFSGCPFFRYGHDRHSNTPARLLRLGNVGHRLRRPSLLPSVDVSGAGTVRALLAGDPAVNLLSGTFIGMYQYTRMPSHRRSS